MQFRLPENLQVELLAYDPALKKLTNQNKTKSITKKSKYPLGNPVGLIPTDVIKESILNPAIEEINASAAPNRFVEFKQFTNVAGSVTTITHAIIYHYEQCWYAAWLPPKGKEDEYVYGYSFAFKDTKTSRKAIPHRLITNIDTYTQVTQGRTVFYTDTKLVTKRDIINGQTTSNWNIPGVPAYYDKSRDLNPAIKRFEDALKKSIPTWEDSRGIFDRIQSSIIANILFDKFEVNQIYWNDTVDTGYNNVKRDKNNWVPSYAAFQDLVLSHAHTTGYDGESYKEYNKILHIINKPFFRKWIQSKCDECIKANTDPDNNLMSRIKQPWSQIHALLKAIMYVNYIWPECPIDYYQTHIEQLIGTHLRQRIYTTAKQWLRKNMPVASFFSILVKNYEKEVERAQASQGRYNYSSTLGLNVYNIYEWNDTVDMITTVVDRGLEVPIPKRWRLEEFHNSVQAESWKIKNPNQELPQDLFPKPIKVTVETNNWTFFQPLDTHQLAQWGQAVRNCVGNATSYAEGVRKKKHFIVLCMLDGAPQFTVQLEVDMGMMSVKQIAGISNARLTKEEEGLYTTAFKAALDQRGNDLKSV